MIKVSFAGVRSHEEACLYALLWATECMSDLHHQYVIFESSTIETRQMMMNPALYPWLGPLVSDINVLLSRIGIWRLDHVLARNNMVANAIASSVTSGHRYQSYIAAKGPYWLQQTLLDHPLRRILRGLWARDHRPVVLKLKRKWV